MTASRVGLADLPATQKPVERARYRYADPDSSGLAGLFDDFPGEHGFASPVR
jgi:hypothetical protein